MWFYRNSKELKYVENSEWSLSRHEEYHNEPRETIDFYLSHVKTAAMKWRIITKRDNKAIIHDGDLKNQFRFQKKIFLCCLYLKQE